MSDLDATQVKDEAKVKQVLMGESSLDGSHELGDSGEELPSEEFAVQIAVDRAIPTSDS